ncbi:hypothetical protein [Cryptosporangium aurantiacum]|nr:hypothetical protein [Cryptosporangium aurantiacum]
MAEIAEKINAVLTARRARLPRIRSEIDRWRRADENVVALDRALNDLCSYPATPPEVVESLLHLRVAEVRPAITGVIERLQQVEARISRDTVNIGVGGQARVGKSTLLQSMSGLCDEHLPTGSGIPVTAVRSRIFHSPGQRRAILDLHTFHSFRTAVLAPYHGQAGLAGAPADLEQFRTWRYPAAGETEDAQHQALIVELREMQEGLWSYADLLERGRPIELTGDEFDGLRDYVAFPTIEQMRHGPVARRYLAVRDIRIECAFPYDEVTTLGLLDMPGLGEIAEERSRHHVVGLRDDVDVVLLVKRAQEGMAYWGDADVRAMTLLDEARGFVDRKDFVFLVLNSGDPSSLLAESVRAHVRKLMNEGQDGRNLDMLEVDARDPQAVADQMLRPVLEHLADRLPAMDAAVLAGTRATSAPVRSGLASAAEDVTEALRALRSATGGTVEDVLRRARALHQDVAVALQELLEDLRANYQNEAYAAAVEDAYRASRDWVNDGLGRGTDVWVADALRSMRQYGGPGPFATVEFNRVRVELSRRYTGLDLFFGEQVEEVLERVTTALGTSLGGLVADEPGRSGLELLRALARGAAEPCENLSTAIDELLDVRLDYRTHLHPQVRPALDPLSFAVRDPQTGAYVTQVAVAPNEDGAQELHQIVAELGEQAAWRIRSELLSQHAMPALVLFTAVEQFADAVLRSGAAEQEFGRLARSYRDELWPGVYEGLDGANARVARVRKRAEQLAAVVTELDGDGE